MSENRHEERDDAPFADRREVEPSREARPGSDSTVAGQEVRTSGGCGTSDPDLAVRAERSEPSSDAKRLE